MKKLAKEFLNRHGIHLVIEDHLPKTYLDGAVCICAIGKPVVALTLRHDKLDNFWFSLMHELAHIALHLDGTETWYLDKLDAKGGDKVEQEADALAQESLIPSDYLNPLEMQDTSSVRQFASSLSTSAFIVAGRVHHELNDHSKFGKAFRDKVRNHF
jgi:HTH-type transcriptional regulator / antitoxin HigA